MDRPEEDWRHATEQLLVALIAIRRHYESTRGNFSLCLSWPFLLRPFHGRSHMRKW